jgi:hypothetical protein
MPCLILMLLLMGPRLVIFLIWLTSGFFDRAYQTNFWPFMGFLFMPYTTISYAVAKNMFGGLDGIGLIVFVLGILLDFGVIGGGASRRRRPPGSGPGVAATPVGGVGSVDEQGLKRVN